MLVVQNLAKKNYLLKFKMATMPIYGKNIQTTSTPELLCQLDWYFAWSIWGTLLYKIAKIIPVGS